MLPLIQRVGDGVCSSGSIDRALSEVSGAIGVRIKRKRLAEFCRTSTAVVLQCCEQASRSLSQESGHFIQTAAGANNVLKTCFLSLCGAENVYCKMIVFGAAIDSVKFLSKSELSSRFFGRLKFLAVFWFCAAPKCSFSISAQTTFDTNFSEAILDGASNNCN